MRHDQHLRAQRVAIAREQDAFGRRLDVRRQQGAMACARGVSVVEMRLSRRGPIVCRMRSPQGSCTRNTQQCAFGLPCSGPASGHSIANSTPSHCQRCPAAHGSVCAPRCRALDHSALRRRQCRHHLTHLDRVEHGGRAARMIGVGVADDQRIERRRRHAPAETARPPARPHASTPGPVPHRTATRDAPFRPAPSVPWPTSSAVRRKLPCGGPDGAGISSGSHVERRGPAQRPATRRETPEHADRRRGERPCVRLRQPPERPGGAGQHLQARWPAGRARRCAAWNA